MLRSPKINPKRIMFYPSDPTMPYREDHKEGESKHQCERHCHHWPADQPTHNAKAEAASQATADAPKWSKHTGTDESIAPRTLDALIWCSPLIFWEDIRVPST